ncbi:DUF7227 family protein [Ottowia caeni]|uniref:DUF7227 family protein n=1 Tax=Ottowia caeni TaxID=2870339 RepID=UPI003D7601EA
MWVVPAQAEIAPVVTILPADQTKPSVTNDERFIAVCTATVRDDVSCATCGICAHPRRRAIIGFPAHGTGAKKPTRFSTRPRSDRDTHRDTFIVAKGRQRHIVWTSKTDKGLE